MIPDAQARQWCKLAAGGDTGAATSLVREFHKLIFAYLRRLTGADADAADLCQVTFLKVWQSLSRFRGESSVSSWIHRIAYCSYVDWLRKSHQPTEQTDSWWAGILAEGLTPSEQAACVETARRIYAAVDGLADDDRQLIHLHYYQGLSLAETAATLSMPGSTLKYRLRAALDQLRSLLREPIAGANQKIPL
jgi:RNA polymerase sigma-70 factor (ECF subfamily)